MSPNQILAERQRSRPLCRVIAAAAGCGDLVHDVAVTAQLWKRSGEEARVTFRCPWCAVVGASPIYGRYEHRKEIWLLAGCPNVPCGNAVLIRVPSHAPWAQLDTGDDGILLAPSCVLPREQETTGGT